MTRRRSPCPHRPSSRDAEVVLAVALAAVAACGDRAPPAKWPEPPPPSVATPLPSAETDPDARSSSPRMPEVGDEADEVSAPDEGPSRPHAPEDRAAVTRAPRLPA